MKKEEKQKRIEELIGFMKWKERNGILKMSRFELANAYLESTPTEESTNGEMMCVIKGCTTIVANAESYDIVICDWHDLQING